MVQHPQKSERFVTRDKELPPLIFGPRRIHYLYSAVLPQIHLTLVSVLQGIVFGILLISIPLPTVFSWPGIYYYLLNQHFYIPYIISAVVIIIIWLQFVEVTMFLFWPLSLVQTLLVFLLTVCEVVAFREIAFLPMWITGLGCIALVGGWITRRNLILNPKEIYEATTGLQKSFKDFYESNRKTSALYFITGSITLALGLVFIWLFVAFKSAFPLFITYLSWGSILFLLICTLLIVRMDLDARNNWIKHAIENTDLVVTSHGVMMYMYENGEKPG